MVFAASFILGFPVGVLLRRLGVVDRPNVRSSHERPTVRGGGIAIMAAVILGAFFARRPTTDGILIPLVGIAVFLAVLSFWDDLRSLPPAIRFGGHAAAALALLALLGWPHLKIEISQTHSIEPWTWCGFILMFLWLTGYTNAFNFMDGINGIAAGQGIITASGTALIIGWVTGDWNSPVVMGTVVVGGACAGFLPHNFPRARMFMGDVSSAPLGFLLAALALWIACDFGWWLLIPLGLLHANFVLDTGITLVRRLLRGERWYEAHREHFYQRLIRAGESHTFVTLLEMGLQLVVLGLMVVYLQSGAISRIGLIVAVIAVWICFFAYCEREFRGKAEIGQAESRNPIKC
jgi:UDP-N-acetylmuramyl pentapeptide phosphotransferase/UDP-N-acetylglucosamine-1-phosphate transferase